MKWMIASDIHGSAYYCSRLIEAYKTEQAERLLLLGDVLYHGPRNPMLEDYNPVALAEKINGVKQPVLICKGNCDSEVDQLVLNMPIQSPYVHAFAGGRHIVATHGHKVEDDEAKDAMAAAIKADIFITGHIHTNVLEKRGSTVFLNPGSPSLSKREDGRQTCAVIEDNKITIYDIYSGEAMLSLDI